MDFQNILERNQIDVRDWSVSFLTAPAKPFFLDPDYLKRCAILAGFPVELTAGMLDYASEIREDPIRKKLAWHLYRLYCCLADFKPFPDHIDLTGDRTGILYLIIFCSLYTHLRFKMQMEGLPEELADRVLCRIVPVLGNRSVHYPGEKGILGRSMVFILNYKNSPCFRLGRFDFVLMPCPAAYPELFRHRESGKYIALCRAGWKVGKTGFLLAPDDESAPPVEFSEKGNCITGRKVNLAKGVATEEILTLDLKEYIRLTGPGSNVLLMHIPGGGGMSLEKCKASFAEARDFFRKYYPEVPISVFGCTSWIFNPDWQEYVPEANMSKLQRATLAFPGPHNPRSGLVFLFARDDGDPGQYLADNSLRRAMIRAWKEKGTLRPGGMLLPFDEVDNFPLDQASCII